MDWANFCILSVDGNTPKNHNWRPPSHFFAAETCARHVYAFLGEHPIPDGVINANRTRLLKGIDAYQFFMKLYCGAAGTKISDKEVSGQMRVSFNKWKETNQSSPNKDNIKNLKRLIEALFHDGGLIKSNLITPYLRHQKNFTSAAEITCSSRPQQILVIGGNLVATVELCAALLERTRPPRLIVTHHNDTDLKSIRDRLKTFNSATERCASQVKFLSFQVALQTEFFRSDTIVTLDKFTDDNDHTLENERARSLSVAWAWRREICPDSGRFVCARRQETPTATEGQLKDAGNFFGFDAIWEAKVKRIKFNQMVLQHVDTIVADFAALRLRGEVAANLDVQTDGLTELSVNLILRRKPRGHLVNLAAAQFSP